MVTLLSRILSHSSSPNAHPQQLEALRGTSDFSGEVGHRGRVFTPDFALGQVESKTHSLCLFRDDVERSADFLFGSHTDAIIEVPQRKNSKSVKFGGGWVGYHSGQNRLFVL